MFVQFFVILLAFSCLAQVHAIALLSTDNDTNEKEIGKLKLKHEL